MELLFKFTPPNPGENPTLYCTRLRNEIKDAIDDFTATHGADTAVSYKFVTPDKKDLPWWIDDGGMIRLAEFLICEAKGFVDLN